MEDKFQIKFSLFKLMLTIIFSSSLYAQDGTALKAVCPPALRAMGDGSTQASLPVGDSLLVTESPAASSSNEFKELLKVTIGRERDTVKSRLLTEEEERFVSDFVTLAKAINPSDEAQVAILGKSLDATQGFYASTYKSLESQRAFDERLKVLLDNPASTTLGEILKNYDKNVGDLSMPNLKERVGLLTRVFGRVKTETETIIHNVDQYSKRFQKVRTIIEQFEKDVEAKIAAVEASNKDNLLVANQAGVEAARVRLGLKVIYELHERLELIYGKMDKTSPQAMFIRDKVIIPLAEQIEGAERIVATLHMAEANLLEMRIRGESVVRTVRTELAISRVTVRLSVTLAKSIADQADAIATVIRMRGQNARTAAAINDAMGKTQASFDAMRSDTDPIKDFEAQLKAHRERREERRKTLDALYDRQKVVLPALATLREELKTAADDERKSLLLGGSIRGN